MPTPIIVGFSSSNRVPGYYGETVYGAGAISASSIPLVLLLAGLKNPSGGTATSNQDIVDILSADAADAAFGAGYELSRMCYAALKVPGVKIKAAPITEAVGAAAATQVITIGGSWSSVGTIKLRINGETITHSAGSTQTVADFCTTLAAVLNENPRRPYTAAATATQVIVTFKSKGARGNNYITFLDSSLVPSGMTVYIAGPTWTATTAKTASAPISFVVPTTANGFYYKCTTGGTTAGGGSGSESASTLLGLLLPNGFDRIVCSQNDSTNLGLWKTQLNDQAGPTRGLLQHFITGVNGTLAAATSLATTLNAERMQIVWQLNGETAPWEISSYLGALRCATEQADPDAAYDDAKLPGVAPHSQPADRPDNSVLQTAINNGLTAIKTSENGSDALICRSVTTHTLFGSTPDYRTLDTSDAYVPDFVRRDLGLYWYTVFKPANPRNADNPPADQKAALSGVATPDLWNSHVEAKLRNYEKGILASGSAPTAATVAPIIINVDFNKPSSGYDPIAKRIMSAVPVEPAPNNHQIGVSVRQVTPS